MNISNLLNVSSTSHYWKNFSHQINTSMTPWSGIILATSVTALAGLSMYCWRQTDSSSKKMDPSFEEAKSRIQRTYAYVFGGFALTAVAAATSHMSGFSLKILSQNNSLLPVGLLITSIVSLMTTVHTSPENQKTKHIAWTIFNVSMGAMLSPIGFLNQALVAQAAFISLGIGGLLSFTAFIAPDRKFLEWEGPLLAALSTITLASTVALFFPRTAYAYGIDRISLYGGLVICSGLFMVNTQRLMNEANEAIGKGFDAINASLGIYLDGINIFTRILRIMVENQKEKT